MPERCSISVPPVINNICRSALLAQKYLPVPDHYTTVVEHSDSPKIISIRFDLIHARKSIRIDSSDSIRIHMAVTQEVRGRGRPGWGPCTACSLAKYGCPTAVSAAVIRRSVVWQADANNQYNRIGRSDFGETESIRIDSLSEWNRIDSNRESECCTL